MSANNTQVGGTHYNSKFQHWDFVHESNLDYFQGQITKYITRNRYKNGVQDLDKAMHFTHKLRELSTNRYTNHSIFSMARLARYAQANKLTGQEILCISSICCWSCTNDLDMAADRIDSLRATLYPPDGPTSAYVNQG